MLPSIHPLLLHTLSPYTSSLYRMKSVMTRLNLWQKVRNLLNFNCNYVLFKQHLLHKTVNTNFILFQKYLKNSIKFIICFDIQPIRNHPSSRDTRASQIAAKFHFTSFVRMCVVKPPQTWFHRDSTIPNDLLWNKKELWRQF